MTAISARRFLLAFSAVFAGLVALLAAHSVVIDPYAMFGSRLWPEKGYEKFGRVRVAGDRIVKALILTEDRFDTVVVGSSRPLVGFAPDYREFAGRQVYNAAFNGATNVENARVAALAVASQSKLKTLIVGLDLFAFEKVKTEADYEQSLLSGANRWTGIFARTFSKDAVDGAWRFWRNVRNNTPQLTRDGFNHTPAKWLVDRREAFIAKVGGGNPNCGAPRRLAPVVPTDRIEANIALLEPVLAAAKARGVDVFLFLPPQHVWAHVVETEAQRAPIPDALKRALRAMTDRLAQKPGAGVLALWDFDGLDAVTMEDVPPRGSKQDMRYFWEHSHFKTATGAAMIATMYGGATALDGFGVRLDRIDLEAHLTATREKLKTWEAAHPQDAAMLRAVVRGNANCGPSADAAEN